MFRFLTRLFALIGFVFILLVAAVAVAALHYGNRTEAEPASVILTMNFDQPVTENGNASALKLALHDNAQTPLLDLLRAIDKAKVDPRVKGIVAHFGELQPPMAVAEEIRDAIRSFRESGKFTYAFGPTYGGFGEGSAAYYLASTFENVWLQPVGTVSLTGVAMQSPFGKTALDKIGVKADFMQREEYKSFMDMATRDDFAPPVKANMQALLDDLSAQLARGIAENRGMDIGHVRDLMAKGPFTDEEALKEKLITRLGYFDELNDELDQKAGKDAKDVDVETYLSLERPKAKRTETPQAKLALIYGTGEITDHDSDAPSFTGDKVLGADTIADAFDDAAEDKNVKGILFRVDSPGGTPEASETIRRAMIHAQKAGKPVYVSMSSVAASGGYWIAMNADHIVAQPATLTGSIGVLAGKFAIGGLLEKIDVSVPMLKSSDNAGMWSPTEEFGPQQRERVNALLDATYRVFTQNVAEARHISPEKIPEFAKGRVWTGLQASQNGLVDELGGLGTTLAALKKRLNLGETDQVEIEVFPAPETPAQRILKLMKTFGVEEAALQPLMSEMPILKGIEGALTTKSIVLRSPVDVQTIR